jgi:hypothetical protein
MVTAAPRQPSPPQTAPPAQQQQLTVGQVVAILATGLAASKTLELLSKTLKPLGIAPDAVRVAFLVGGRRTRLRRPGQGVTVLRSTRTPALASTLAGEDTFRAAYLYAAAQRVQKAADSAARNGLTRAEALRQAETRERRFYSQHLDAQARRWQAAAWVDGAALRHGRPFIDAATGTATRLVGWHATLDARTSPECRAANGANFPANRPPSIGWPGAVHPHCRCKPGVPFATSRMVDPATTRRAA